MKMKKQFVAMIVTVTVILAGAAGFGGTYLANSFMNLPMAVYEETSPVNQSTSISDNTKQLNSYLDAYLSEYLRENDESLSNLYTTKPGTFLLSNTNDNTAAKILTIPEIAALNSNSVVEIYTETVANSGRMGQFVTEGAGSGVINTSDGYIITNNHVISGARKITVLLKNGAEYEATLIGRDSKTDLAVIKINATGLKSAVYGNSDKLIVGELAVAIGNPLGQLGGSVTEGIISALSRNIDIDGEMMTLLQTTAAVNPGNSGGGLFNNYGELIGVVNAKSSGSDIEGIGFAIPVNTVKTVVESLIKYGYVPGRIDFGATLIDIFDTRIAMMYRVQSTGVYVSQADSDSVLIAGDRIISIDGKEIKSSTEVKSLLDTHKVGDTISITVSRNGQNTTVRLQLKQAKT